MTTYERFRVTDRSTEDIFLFLGLSYEDLPREGTVFVAGSGLYNVFERDISSRVDRVIACDPSLGILGSETESEWVVRVDDRNGGGKYSATYVRGAVGPDLVPAREHIQSRLKGIPSNITIVTNKIPPIAAPDNSIDLGVDVIGASNYMSEELFLKYLQEIFRTLKPGGQFRLGPLNKIEWWEDIFAVVGILMPKDIELERFDIWNDSFGLIVRKKVRRY